MGANPYGNPYGSTLGGELNPSPRRAGRTRRRILLGLCQAQLTDCRKQRASARARRNGSRALPAAHVRGAYCRRARLHLAPYRTHSGRGPMETGRACRGPARERR